MDIIEIVLTRRPPEVAGAVDDFFAKQYSTELLDCARATHALETAMDKPGAVLNRICDDALALDKAFITGDQCNIPAALGRTIVNAVTTLRASLGAGQVTPEQIQALRKSLEALARELRTLIRGQLSSQDPAAKAIKAMLQAGIPLQDRKAVPQGAASTSAATAPLRVADKHLDKLLDAEDPRALARLEEFADTRMRGHEIEVLRLLRDLTRQKVNLEDPATVMALGDRLAPLVKKYLSESAAQHVPIDAATGRMFSMALKQLEERRTSNPGQLAGIGRALTVAVQNAHDQLYARVHKEVFLDFQTVLKKLG